MIMILEDQGVTRNTAGSGLPEPEIFPGLQAKHADLFTQRYLEYPPRVGQEWDKMQIGTKKDLTDMG
jgi:hypothetical protein